MLKQLQMIIRGEPDHITNQIEFSARLVDYDGEPLYEVDSNMNDRALNADDLYEISNFFDKLANQLRRNDFLND